MQTLASEHTARLEPLLAYRLDHGALDAMEPPAAKKLAAGARKEMDADASPAAGGEAGQEAQSVQAASLADAFLQWRSAKPKAPRETETPKPDSAPGREGRQHAEEGHALEVIDVAVAACKPP